VVGLKIGGTVGLEEGSEVVGLAMDEVGDATVGFRVGTAAGSAVVGAVIGNGLGAGLSMMAGAGSK